MRSRAARWAAAIAAGLAGLMLVVLAFAWSGVYSVAASHGHWALTDWFLTFVMQNSVKTRAIAVEVPQRLDDPDLVTLGAAHFHSGCAGCHGAPGVAPSLITSGMLPPPPDLASSIPKWTPAELFWIVHNGIKYTGMPAWPAPSRGDEIWAVVAFLMQLPNLDEAGYRRIAGKPADPLRDAGEVASHGARPTTNTCRDCHGTEENGPPSGFVPVLHSQSAQYLTQALEAYAKGSRESGFMQPIAVELTPEEIRSLAEYYSALPRPLPREASTDSDAVKRGERIALKGIPDHDIPPCNSCHTRSARPSYPLLAGQNAVYLMTQLKLWKRGANRRTEAPQIMAPIAERLSDAEIEDVSTFFSQMAEPAVGAAPP
jgi:cytochrome c553